MKSLSILLFLNLAFVAQSQNLDSLSTTLTVGDFLSISSKKVYNATDAIKNKSVIDFVLLETKSDGKQKLEWVNMSGKDGNIPKEMIGTASLINAISFDKEQFNSCKTNKDLQRMTGHLTNSSFSHFASISDDIKKGVLYHCFIIQMENGKRALLWLDNIHNGTLRAILKVQH